MAGGEAGARSGFILAPARPNHAERAYLKGALGKPGRKLPLFDAKGRPVRPQLIRTCLARGWAERWFANPLAPDWLVCRLTEAGEAAVRGGRR